MITAPNLVHTLPAFDEQRNLRVVVETPKGANFKLKYDDKHGCFSLTRILPLGLVYPYDFGFIPQTLAADGDPLDVMVVFEAATYPGVVIPCRLLGALQIEERGMRGRANHRLVALPVKAARKDHLRDYQSLQERVLRELERFFVMTTAFTTKDPQLRGWVGPQAASDMVHRAIQRYRESTGRGPRSTMPPPLNRDDRDDRDDFRTPDARPGTLAEARPQGPPGPGPGTPEGGKGGDQ